MVQMRDGNLRASSRRASDPRQIDILLAGLAYFFSPVAIYKPRERLVAAPGRPRDSFTKLCQDPHVAFFSFLSASPCPLCHSHFRTYIIIIRNSTSDVMREFSFIDDVRVVNNACDKFIKVLRRPEI